LVDRRGATTTVPGFDPATRPGRIATVALPRASHTPVVTLVRPDGYVAWATDQADATGLGAALDRWCGQKDTNATV
jgi:hypothetical protein